MSITTTSSLAKSRDPGEFLSVATGFFDCASLRSE